MKLRILLAASLSMAFLLGLSYLLIQSDRGEKAASLNLTASADCRECHFEVYAEWQASWHAKAWTDPLVRAENQSDNFKKKDCIPCHAPRPIFERGFAPGERVVERVANREDGVDCIACHKLPQGGMASAHQDLEGPCDPTYHPGIVSVAHCNPCHNQHNTIEEWRQAPESMRGANCNGCHMPEVVRPASGDRPERMGKSHLFPGGNDPEFMKDSFSLYHELSREMKESEETRIFRVRIVNDKAAHNLPTDSRNRALDLVLTFLRPGQVPIPSMEGARDYGQEPGTYRLRFRNPYRSEVHLQDTQIKSGGEAVLEAPVPDHAEKALIQLIYKLTPFMTDSEGLELARELVSLE